MGLNFDDVLEANDAMSEAIGRVRELHKVIEVGLPDGRFMGACSGCMEGVDYNNDYTFADYPCPTIKALDGEQ